MKDEKKPPVYDRTCITCGREMQVRSIPAGEKSKKPRGFLLVCEYCKRLEKRLEKDGGK
jgi:hypothetical protein